MGQNARNRKEAKAPGVTEPCHPSLSDALWLLSCHSVVQTENSLRGPSVHSAHARSVTSFRPRQNICCSYVQDSLNRSDTFVPGGREQETGTQDLFWPGWSNCHFHSTFGLMSLGTDSQELLENTCSHAKIPHLHQLWRARGWSWCFLTTTLQC